MNSRLLKQAPHALPSYSVSVKRESRAALQAAAFTVGGIALGVVGVTIFHESVTVVGLLVIVVILLGMVLMRGGSHAAAAVAAPAPAAVATTVSVETGETLPEESEIEEEPEPGPETAMAHGAVVVAYHDELTGLPNRNNWQDLLRRHVQAMASRDDAGIFAVMFVDLDDFKDVNDTFGHAQGDRVLLEAVRRIRTVLRPYDVVGRIGGDEFGIFLGEIRRAREAEEVAGRLREALHTGFSVHDSVVRLGASIGIALYPEHGLTAETLVQYADMALYWAKREGGNAHRSYEPAMSDEFDQRVHTKNALSRALADREFVLYYQPLLNLSTGRCDHAEALIRWNDPQKGVIAPGNFIPIAEETGMMLEIGRWTVEAAADQLRAWNRMERPARISLNASVKQFRDPDFFTHLENTLKSYDVEPWQVELEVTESVAVADIEGATQILSRLQKLGVKTVLDDFGTHYSSLKYLQELPFNTIKIDQSFVKNLPESDHDAAIVRGVIALGHDLGRTLVAEGVETREQLDWLRKAGCDVVQGYLVERPMPAGNFTKWRSVQIPYGLTA